MAEKRVSVRLVAEGGRQVRAELEGIGDAGARGFGRLSSEMELANTRLGSFARKAGIALAAVTVAAAAAGVAMVRSGLDDHRCAGRHGAHRCRPRSKACRC